MTKKINRKLTADEIREINDECVARSAIPSTPAHEWVAVAEGDDWTLCKIDTLPDTFALLTNSGEPLILEREDVVAQLGERDAIAAGVGPTKYTDEGEYELIAEVNDDGYTDASINLYVGRAADGHCDLLASDSASIFVVGNADDAQLNRDHWDTIEGHGLDMDAVRAVDTALADWLTDRYNEARRATKVNA